MTFNVAADSYDRFMGQYSVPLATEFADFADVGAAERAVDVGCGPGALTAVLVERLGASSVSAVDPSPPFVTAIKQRLPGVDIRECSAEHLPFVNDSFDRALAQLVVHFMADPVAGLRELARVTRPGGLVAACVWDHGGGAGPLSTFWRAVHDIDPSAPGEAQLAGTREGHLEELFNAAELTDVKSSTLTVEVPFGTLDDWWQPYTLGVGPAGAYVSKLDERGRATLRAQCETILPEPPFTVSASAWAVGARVGERA